MMGKGRWSAELAFEVWGVVNSVVLGAWFEVCDRNYGAAEEKVRAASSIGSPFGDDLAVTGTVFLMSGKPELARQAFVDAMRTSPFHPPWYANRLVTCLILLERYAEAAQIAQSIVEKGDQGEITTYAHARALVSLIIIANQEKKADVAEELVKRLIEVNPNFSQKTLGMYIGQMRDTAIIENFRNILGEYGLPSGV